MQKIIWQRRSVEYFFEENQLIRQRGRDCAETTKMAGVFFVVFEFFLLDAVTFSLFWLCVHVSACVSSWLRPGYLIDSVDGLTNDGSSIKCLLLSFVRHRIKRWMKRLLAFTWFMTNVQRFSFVSSQGSEQQSADCTGQTDAARIDVVTQFVSCLTVLWRVCRRFGCILRQWKIVQLAQCWEAAHRVTWHQAAWEQVGTVCPIIPWFFGSLIALFFFLSSFFSFAVPRLSSRRFSCGSQATGQQPADVHRRSGPPIAERIGDFVSIILLRLLLPVAGFVKEQHKRRSSCDRTGRGSFTGLAPLI